MKSQMRFKIARTSLFGTGRDPRFGIEARVPGGDWHNPIPGAVRIDTLREAFDQIETLASVFKLEAYSVKVEYGD